jgi:ribosomal protein S18 acetylase RimI-like enzyme
VAEPSRGRLILREARAEDARSVAAVHVASWQSAYRGHLPDAHLDGLSVDDRTATWEAFMAKRPTDHLVVAELDGEVVGFASTGPSTDSGADPAIGEVYTLYLHPDRWGTGAGRALLEYAAARLAADGFTHATLWVLGTNQRARRFYQRQGWTQVEGVRTQEFGGQVVTDYRYGKTLGEG